MMDSNQIDALINTVKDHAHNNANYWSHDDVGESFEVMDIDELKPGDVVQFQIYEQSYE